MTSEPQQQPESLADRLRDVVVEMRGELDISRHVFRDGPAYVMRDPITFATHRFDPEDYTIISSIRRDWTLGETFEHLVTAGHIERDEEDDYYAFILDLHQRSLLTLPINNADALFQRFERRRRAENMSKLLGVFFLRVPLINPDRLLTQTLPLFRWMFTFPAFIAWLGLGAAALVVVVARFDDLTSPAAGILDGNNLFLLWGALIGLKVVHEFGHAYACKAFGGHVPEMGAFMILFTPVAYVDATDSWTFSKIRHRAVVTLGGMYFESIVGAIAVFVWAATETSTLHALSYQIIILATVTTAAFNLNPLLKYDAYYLVSDLVAIPNLRARCQESLGGMFKKYLFGIKADREGQPLEPRPKLALFGLAQAGYKTGMMITISTVLVMKFGGLGIGLAVLMVGMMLFKSIMSLARYVLGSEETAPVRVRAVLTTFGLAGVALMAMLLVPIAWPVEARGVVSFSNVGVINAPVSGTLVELNVEQGQARYEGQRLVVISDDDKDGEYRALLAEHETGRARIALAAMESPGAGFQAGIDIGHVDARIERVAADIGAQSVMALNDGLVLDVYTANAGAHVEQGQPLFLYASGEPEAVFHIRSFEFDALKLGIGDELVCRSPADASQPIVATVTHIAAVGTRDIDNRIRQAAPQGLVPISPVDGRATEPYFEIRLSLHPSEARFSGSALLTRMKTHPRTTASVIERRVVRFLNRVKEGAG